VKNEYWESVVKKNIIFVVIASIVSIKFTYLNAGLMPGLKKMRDKLDKALESSPVTTFKDLVQPQGEHSKSLQISGSGVRFVSVSNAYSGDARIKDVQEKIKTLHWSLQHDVIASIKQEERKQEERKQEERTNKNQALVIIKDAVSKKYTGLKSPLLLFAQDLAREELILKNLDQELTKLLLANDVRSDKGLLKVVKTLHVDVKVASGDLQDLIGCVNNLLMA